MFSFEFGTLEILSSVGLQRAEHSESCFLTAEGEHNSHVGEASGDRGVFASSGCELLKLSNKEIQRKTPGS